LIKQDVISKINGHEILIKPNCLQSAVPLSCTHVDALRGILDFLKELSTEPVIVAETCGGSELFESFKRLDYTSLADEYAVSLNNPQGDNDWIDAYLLNRSYQDVKVKISRKIFECGCRISAAVAKTHDTVTVTGSWKNMMGALALEDKVKMHGCNSHGERILISEVEILPQNLIRIAKIVPPHISVIDGFIGMEGEGPVRGTEKYLGIAIASTDFVSADAVCAKAMGFEPLEISYLKYGNQLGLGKANLDDIEIIGEPIENVITRFTPHSHYPTQRQWMEILPSLPI
ncbi:MAG: hypothetical protein QG588_1444, partial [Candidatus Poribacteria bacterium]|nr:hypothetical protein [Candidatus Poribacteria bacterium]